ncbi:MAG: DNA polymerase III subunit beta [Pleurocapsa sp.]
MKIVCSQSDLKSNLALANRAVPSSRPEPPVLGNVLLIADETSQKVSITAFDGSLGIKTSFSAEVAEGGSITLPAKLLNEIVSKLPEVEITLESADDEDSNFLATLSSPSGTFQLTGIDAEEFPELPTVENGETLELPISALTGGLSGCLFAASTELSKQILTGVHIKTQDNEGDILEFAATDSHRLAVVETSLNPETEEASESVIELPNFAVTIPAKALRELEKIVSDAQDSDTVKVSFDDNQMNFTWRDRILTSAKIPGDYPAYGQLIPRSFAREMTVERKRLLTSLELVAVMAQKNSIVKFSLNNERKELIISADAQDMGNAQQFLPAEIMGESIDIAFNIKYLMDGLKALSATEIKMQLNEWNQPVIFTPLGGQKMTYLVMPVQIRN